MAANRTLEARVSALESSLRRSRRVALLLGAALALVTAAAMVPQATDQVTRQLISQPTDEVTTRRLILTDPSSPGVVLVPGPASSLIIQTPSGEEVLRLGGPAARRVNH